MNNTPETTIIANVPTIDIDAIGVQPVSTKAINEMDIIELVDALNDSAYAVQHGKIKKTIEENLTKTAAELKTQRIAELLSLSSSKEAFFMEFIKNPEYTYQGLKEDKKDGNFKLSPKIGNIRFDEIDKEYQKTNKNTLANSLRYVGMINYFLHNIISSKADSMAEGAPDGSKIVTIPAKQIELDNKEYDFSGFSNNALEKQLNAIVETILPETMTVKMLKADVQIIDYALIKVKPQKGNKVKAVISNEKTVTKMIFTVINHRMNNIPYEFESFAKVHKVKKPQGN